MKQRGSGMMRGHPFPVGVSDLVIHPGERAPGCPVHQGFWSSSTARANGLRSRALVPAQARSPLADAATRSGTLSRCSRPPARSWPTPGCTVAPAGEARRLGAVVPSAEQRHFAGARAAELRRKEAAAHRHLGRAAGAAQKRSHGRTIVLRRRLRTAAVYCLSSSAATKCSRSAKTPRSKTVPSAVRGRSGHLPQARRCINMQLG